MNWLANPIVWVTIAAAVATFAVLLLRRRPRGPEELTPRQRERIAEIARAYFERRGKKVRIEDGTLSLDSEDEAARSEFGLINLGQISLRLMHAPESEWEKVAADFFATMLASRHEMSEFEKDEDNFEKAKPFLAIRIWPEEFLKTPPQVEMQDKQVKAIFRRHMKELLSVLVYDLPSGIRQVLPNILEKWGKTEDEVFEIAMDNMRRAVPREYQKVELDGEAPIFLFADENFLTATRALIMEDIPELIGKAGSLIGLPTRQVFIALPLNDAECFKRLHVLAAMIQRAGENQPGQITDQIFWYRDGKYTEIPYELNVPKRRFGFEAPDEFKAAYAEMSGGGMLK